MRFKQEAPWREVTRVELDELLKIYPRPVQADPPLDRPAQFRRFIDCTLGIFPNDAVATWNVSRKAGRFAVRIDIADWRTND